MKISIRQMSITAIFLAISIVSMFFKNLNVYFSGTIVNTCLILITFFAGIVCGIITSIITPIFSFFITGSPIIAAVPLIMPMIMIGNIILCLFVGIYDKNVDEKNDIRIIIPMIIGSIAKAIFMGVTIALIIVPMFLPEKMHSMMPVVQMTFSFVQLITALLASVFSIIIKKTNIYNIVVRFSKKNQ